MLRKINTELKGGYTIHKDDLKQVLKAIDRNTKHIEITFNPDVAVFKIDNKEKFIFNVMQQDYINYKQLISTEFNLAVTVEAKKIINGFILLIIFLASTVTAKLNSVEINCL